MTTRQKTGALHIVATPIGNLQDITLRALDVLKNVSLIAAEDTRRTRKLLTHHGIKNRLMSLNADAEKSRIPAVLEILDRGEDVAVVCSAGTPGSSDPGGLLAAEAASAGHRVIPIPGPSAVASAISTCGALSARFAFEGFLPRSGQKRRRRIQAIAAEDRPVVIFESPRRVTRTLTEIFEACGDRTVSVHREMTKVHEDIFSVELREIAEKMIVLPEKGEYTLVIKNNPLKGEKRAEHGAADIGAALDVLMSKGMSTRDAVDAASLILGLPRRKVYEVAKSGQGD